MLFLLQEMSPSVSADEPLFYTLSLLHIFAGALFMHYLCIIGALFMHYLYIIIAAYLYRCSFYALSMHYWISFYALSLLHIYALSVLFLCDPMAVVHGWRSDGCSQGALSQSVAFGELELSAAALVSLNCQRHHHTSVVPLLCLEVRRSWQPGSPPMVKHASVRN
jgi:hypothetical protein